MKSLFFKLIDLFINKLVKTLTSWKVMELKKELQELSIININSKIYFKSIPFIKKHPNSIFKIGEGCTILNSTNENYAGVSFVTSIVTATNNAKLVLGDNVGISGCSICCVNEIQIGNNVNLGTGSKIYDTDFHPLDYLERRKNPGFDLDKISNAPIIIGNDVWIGSNSIILKGVTLGDRVIVGAGSIVTKSFPADCIIAGNPAKVIKNMLSS